MFFENIKIDFSDITGSPSSKSNTESSFYHVDVPLKDQEPSKSNREVTKSLGVWKLDKKKRKRVYTTLLGENFYGMQAVKFYRSDKVASSCFLRLELTSLCNSAPCLKMLKFCFENNLKLENYRDDSFKFLESWGIPSKVHEKYRNFNVTELYDWQVDCLCENNGAVLLRNKNLIYTAPTSGGKTLVSEILMLHSLAKSEKNSSVIFYVVPFISLVEEKSSYLRKIWSDLRIGIKTFHGDNVGGELTDDVDIAICTIEKANSLLNFLLDTGKEKRLKLVVIDEIHLLSDNSRGFLIEIFIAKLKFSLFQSVQIVGMSATLPNIDKLAHLLDADLFNSYHRPVELSVRVCIKSKLYECMRSDKNNSNISHQNEFDCSFKFDRSLSDVSTSTTSSSSSSSSSSFSSLPSSKSKSKSSTLASLSSSSNQSKESKEGVGSIGSVGGLGSSDSDDMVVLCLETLSIGKSVLLFCPSKRRCEVCAELISKHLNHSKSKRIEELLNEINKLNTKDKSERIKFGRLNVINELKNSPVGLSSSMQVLILNGIAYHHGGLVVEERKIIENAYRNGFISILTTTSTLAAGVNLPAHRVIIRSPKIANIDLSVSSFRQMCGRAGRKNLDTSGEAILMIQDNMFDRKLAGHLICGDVSPLKSALNNGQGGGVEKLFLEMISCRKLTCTSQLNSFMKCTLLSLENSEEQIESWTKSAFTFLEANNFILSLPPSKDHQDMRRPLVPSAYGIATVFSGINPKDSIEVLNSLLAARKKFVQRSNFHAVFLVTPPEGSGIEPPWKRLEEVITSMYNEYPDIEKVATYLGVDKGELFNLSRSPPSLDFSNPRIKFYRRFFTAMVLYRLVHEVPLQKIETVIQITPGRIQSLQKDAAYFCHMVILFCKKLNWLCLADALTPYTNRLSFGVHEELVPLVRVGTEIPAFRARALYRNGIKCPKDVLDAGKDKLLEILQSIVPFESDDPLNAAIFEKSKSYSCNLNGTEILTNFKPQTNSAKKHHESRENLQRKSKLDQERWLMSCERLANKILSRVKTYMKEEQNSLEIIKNLRGATI